MAKSIADDEGTMTSTLLQLVLVSVCLIPGRGQFRVYANAGGLFGAFAHDHVIEAQKIEGCADVEKNSVKVTFKTAGLKVLDPKEKAEDREKVQKNMETEVLRVSEYPEIVFQSTGMEGTLLKGNLTIRGKTQPVAIPVKITKAADGTYEVKGEYKVKQTDFGIQPIKLMGGTVRVKDEVRTEFDLFLK
jgi:polyisoprenoid-binding protein YceI